MVDNADLRTRYEELAALPATASAGRKRDRGRAFERLLHAVLDEEGLDPRTNYRPAGEEIDGSFKLGERFFLLEAKWHADPLPMSAISPLRDKVDGKLEGTLGLFVSASGFSEDAPAALVHGKKVNVILWDRGDLDELFLTDRTFRAILDEKMRRAAEEGLVLVSMRDAEKEKTPRLRVRRGIAEALKLMREEAAEAFLQAAQQRVGSTDDAALRAAVDEVADSALTALKKGSTWEDAQAFKAKMAEAGGIAVCLLQKEEDFGDDTFLVRQLRITARRVDNFPPPWELWLLTLRYYADQLGAGHFREESLARIAGLLIEATLAVDDFDWADPENHEG
jgi:Restriction endonuclease